MSEVQPEVVVQSEESKVALDGGQVTPIEPTDGEQKPVEEVKKDEPKTEEPKTEEQKKNHDQRRWERILRERAEYKAKAEFLEKMQTQQVAAQNTGEPKREQFPDDLAYLEARQDYKLKQIAEKAAPQPQNNWSAKEDAVRSAIPDFDDVIEDARDRGITIPQPSADAIASSEIGPEIQYYIAKNPREAEKLWRLSNPVDQIRAIGRIEASIEAEKNKKPVKVSAAPKPIAPVKTHGGPIEIDRDKLSDKEWRELRNKEKLARWKQEHGITT